MTHFFYKKDINDIYKFKQFIYENQEKVLKEDDEKFWFEDIPVYIPTIQNQIDYLESQITIRRMREAMLGNEESLAFIKDIEAQIELLRAKLVS